jgi:hypothetical protein
LGRFLGKNAHFTRKNAPFGVKNTILGTGDSEAFDAHRPEHRISRFALSALTPDGQIGRLVDFP